MEVYDAFRQITGIQIVRFLKIIGTYRYYVDIDQGIHKGKMKVAINEKRKKTTWVFFLHKHSKF